MVGQILVNLHGLQLANMKSGLDYIIPTENRDLSWHLNVSCLHTTLLSRHLWKIALSVRKLSLCICKVDHNGFTESISARKYYPQSLYYTRIIKVYIIPESYINHVTSMTSKQEFRYICLYSIHMHVYTHTVLAFHFVQWRRWDILKNIYLYIYFPLKVRKKNKQKNKLDNDKFLP